MSLLLSLTLAQSVELNCMEIGEETVCFRAETELELEGAEARATVNGPSMTYIGERGKPQITPMIELRQDFNTEMDASVNDVR